MAKSQRLRKLLDVLYMIDSLRGVLILCQIERKITDECQIRN